MMMATCVRHYITLYAGIGHLELFSKSQVEFGNILYIFLNTCHPSIYSSCNNLIFRQVPFSARNVSAIIGGISDSIFVSLSAVPVTNAAGTTYSTPDGYYTIMYTTDPQDLNYLHA